MNALNPQWIFWLVILPIGLIFSAILHWKRSRRLGLRYWSKPCTGREWKKQFPDASKFEIRGFLDVFVKAFGFSRKRRLSFSPSDKVMDIYRTLYPPGMASVDCMEWESLLGDLERKYGLALAVEENTLMNVTLGELFASTRGRTQLQ